MPGGRRPHAPCARERRPRVWEVWDAHRACRCIAKTLGPEAGRGARTRLLREGRLLRRLAHPHLVRAYAVFDDPPAAVLETLDGATVSWMVREGGIRLTAEDLAHLGVHLASAMAYPHAEGRLHLDLKPSSVICDAGHAKVIDLSLARRPGRVPRGLGTAQYLSPEQARGEEAGPAADVFGIGATLWGAATGGWRGRSPTSSTPAWSPEPAQRPGVREVLAACADVAGE